MMARSNLATCYEGIQRIYRNAIVAYIRERFRTAFKDDYAERLKKPFLKEWDTIRESALERRRTGELSGSIADDFDLLGVNHFYNLFDAYNDVLAPSTMSAEKGVRRKETQALLTWMKTVKNLRDPLSHPSSEDFSYEDSFSLLDCGRRVLKVLGLQQESARLHELMKSLGGVPTLAVSDRDRLEDRLPPRETIVLDFVGRRRELEKFRTPDPWSKSMEQIRARSA